MTREAVLVVSHGTVDDLDDLGAFVAQVRRGRQAPPELVAELRRRYEAIGGSPLNRINLALAAKLAARLGVPVASANRLWRPFVRDVLAELARDGVGRAVVLPLAQHSVHVYEDDAAKAAAGSGVQLACVPPWGQREDLAVAFATRIAAELSGPGDLVVMTAHSLPQSVVDAGDPYERDVRASAAAITAAVCARAGRQVPALVAFQSQTAGSSIPWLGPDLAATLDAAKARGAERVVFAPIGFLADHVEVLYDLDVEARTMALDRGLTYARAASLNADDDFADLLAAVARPLLGGASPGGVRG